MPPTTSWLEAFPSLPEDEDDEAAEAAAAAAAAAASIAAATRASSFSTRSTISAHSPMYRASIMLAGTRNWKVVESSLGRKALRTRPVPPFTGLPLPPLGSVSVAALVTRVKR